MKAFEERLGRLEQMAADLKNPQLPLEEALTRFEEGLKLAKGLEKDLAAMERRVEILVQGGNPEAGTKEKPGEDAGTFELFSE